MASPKPGDVIIVLLGNGGEGKSTISNAYIGNARFPSDVDLDGEGMTKHCSMYRVNDDTLICDSPGMSTEKKISDEIMNVFKHKDVTYKVVFVVGAEAGRIESFDIDNINNFYEMMKIGYSIIVNKLSEIAMKIDYKGGMERYLNKAPSSVLPLKIDDDAEGEENVILKSSDIIREFINAQESFKVEVL